MNSKFVFLPGIAILLMFFGATALSVGKKSETKSLVVKLVRAPGIDRQGFLLLKESLEKAGHSTFLPQEADNPNKSTGDVGVFIMPIEGFQRDKMSQEVVGIVHYGNKRLAQCIEKELSRCVNLTVKTFEKKLPFLQQDMPSVVIKVFPQNFEKYSHRYAKGIVEGIEEYVEKL